MRRRDDPNVYFDLSTGTDGTNHAVFQHPQQPRLKLDWKLAQLIEKQRSSAGFRKAAGMSTVRAGKCAALMAEQLAFDQLFGQRTAVDGDERSSSTTLLMKRFGHQLFAGATFTQHQDRQRRWRKALKLLAELVHLGTFAEQLTRCGRVQT